MSALVCLPSHNIIDEATSVTVTTAAAAYPKEYLYDNLPNYPYKATATSTDIVITFSGARSLDGVSLINHNLAGATVALTNNNGLNTSIVIPVNLGSGLCVNPWKDLRSVGAAASATTWTIGITGAAANVAIGEVILADTLTSVDLAWGVGFQQLHPVIQHRTAYKVPIKFGLGVRYRIFKGTGGYSSAARDTLLALHHDAEGPYKPFLFVLDETENDAAFVTWREESFINTFDGPDYELTDVEFEEFNSGVAL